MSRVSIPGLFMEQTFGILLYNIWALLACRKSFTSKFMLLKSILSEVKSTKRDGAFAMLIAVTQSCSRLGGFLYGLCDC
jgi:hypothetical protein